jgi:hypothetical protein
MASTLQIRVRIHGLRDVTVNGRNAWALLRLIEAGENGCTPLERPAPRWSDYIFQLRGMGFVIETIHERHGGPFPGNHGRYVLRSRVTVLQEEGLAA